MSAPLERAILLFQQGRFDLAGQAFREVLANAPNDPFAHAYFALCLLQSKEREQALAEAELALGLLPDFPLPHYVRGRVFLDQSRLKDAEAAAQEAIRLDPQDADYRGLLASIELGRRRWAAALEAADQGLALDPEHGQCTNLRAIALVQLGRKNEAAVTLGTALENDPENAVTHANQGWAHLHRGDHVHALEHFREALRIDPELAWAQAGIVEALKARYFIYRWMLRFFLWMSRQSKAAQWIFVLAFIFGRSALAQVASAYPALAPYIFPVLSLTFGFLLLSWIASPLFNFLLQFNRFGRMALTRDQRLASTVIGLCFLLAACCFAASTVSRSFLAQVGTMYFGLLLMPLAVTFRRNPGRPRRVMALYTAGVALLGLPVLSIALLGNASPWRNPKLAIQLFFPYFILGTVLSTWFSALFGRSMSDD